MATIERLFDPACEPEVGTLIRKTSFSHIDLIPASSRLERFSLSGRSLWEQTDLQHSLREALSSVIDEYDYILLDCPPSLSLVSYAALTASDSVMIPLESAMWGAFGTQHIIQAMQEVQRTVNDRLQLLGYVLSRFKQRRSYQQSYEDVLREQFGKDVFQTVIPDLAPFEKAVTDRTPITLHSPSSHAADIARNFFCEVEARLQKLTRGSERVGTDCLSASVG